MEAAKIPGAAMVVIRDGQIESAEGYGIADVESGRKVTPDTLFTIASVSKTVTATALITLYEQGKFNLNDDINQYLPFELRNPNFPNTPITFRMLLTHTSSIHDSDIYNQYYTLQEEPVLPDSPIALGDYLKDYLTHEGKLYSAKDNFLEDAPGTTYTYSNTGFGLVGLLVEQISGMPFDQYCKTAIFEPLGMGHSAWLFKNVDTEEMAIPYGYNDLLRQPKPYGFYGYPTYPDGALKTSVNEYARFLSIFINEGKTFEGGQFLKPETVKEMLTLQTYPGLEDKSIGLAWHSGSKFYNHTGGDAGINTFAAFEPVSRTGAILFTNGGGEFDIPGLARQVYFGQQAVILMKVRMGTP
jgi:CubicO group peptidase (beta-lactamase class C family)